MVSQYGGGAQVQDQRQGLRAVDAQNTRTYAQSAFDWIDYLNGVRNPTVLDVSQFHFALSNVRVRMTLLKKKCPEIVTDTSPEIASNISPQTDRFRAEMQNTLRFLRAEAQKRGRLEDLEGGARAQKSEIQAYYALLHDYLVGRVEDAPEDLYQGAVCAPWRQVQALPQHSPQERLDIFGSTFARRDELDAQSPAGLVVDMSPMDPPVPNPGNGMFDTNMTGQADPSTAPGQTKKSKQAGGTRKSKPA